MIRARAHWVCLPACAVGGVQHEPIRTAVVNNKCHKAIRAMYHVYDSPGVERRQFRNDSVGPVYSIDGPSDEWDMVKASLLDHNRAAEDQKLAGGCKHSS